jgi:hypothetical protein
MLDKKKVYAYIEKSKNKLQYYDNYSKYIDLLLSDENVILKYNPTNLDKSIDYFKIDYLSDYFGYGSRSNLIYRKFYEDKFINSKKSLPNDSNYMDGYGLVTASNINIDEKLLVEFRNLLSFIYLI